MNTIRSVIFFLWLYGMMTIYALVCLPVMLVSRAGARAGMRAYSRSVLFGLRWIMGITVEIRGREHIPSGAVLVAGKHQAMLDVFIPIIMFQDALMVMKEELLWYPGLGWYALRSKMIAIQRGGTARTVKKMVAQAKVRIHEGKGRQLVIFPEGTRGAPGEKTEYHPAGTRAFYKALNLPLLPVATNSGLCWKARGITRRPGHVVYEALPVIEPGLGHKEMLERLEREIEAASDRLLDEGLKAQGRTRADL